MPPVDFEKFWTDPKHQGDRDFFEKSVARVMQKKIDEAKLKNKNKPQDNNLFDDIFGGKEPESEDGE